MHKLWLATVAFLSLCLVTPSLPAGDEATEPFLLDIEPSAGDVVVRDVTLPPPIDPPTTSAPGKPVTLSFAGSVSQLEGLVLWSWTDTGLAPLQAEVVTVAGGTRLGTDAGCAPGARIVALAETLIGATDPLEPEACESELLLAPRAEVTGRLIAPPRGEGLPDHTVLRQQRCGERGRAHEPIVEIPITIDEAGGFRAPVAAESCSCLTFVAGDYATVTLHREKTEAETPRDLGEIALQAGGALLVHVVSGADARGLADVVVDVVPAGESAEIAASVSEGRPWQAHHRAQTSEDGWARLSGLPAGLYGIWIDDGGDRPPHVGPMVDVVANQETFLGDVVLPAPAELTLTLAPSRELEERVEHYQIHLESADGAVPVYLETTGAVPVTLTLQPGEWRLAVLARAGERWHPVARRSLRIETGEQRALDLDLEPAVVRGRVTYLGEPVTGTIDLRGLDEGQPGIRSRLDNDGRFESFAGAPGRFEARVWVDALKQAVEIPEVRLEAGESTEIALPAGRLEGRVVTANGQPVDGALVKAVCDSTAPDENGRRSGELDATNRSGTDGGFVLEGLMACGWLLTAKHAGRRSTPLEVSLGPDEVRDVGDVELPAEDDVVVRVEDRVGRPVSGSLVYGYLVTDGSPQARFLQIRTDAEGRLALPVAADTEGRVGLAVTAAGGLSTLSTALQPEIVWRPSPAPGRLALDRELVGHHLLAPDGTLVIPELVATDHGDLWIVEGVEIGVWRLVETGSMEEIAALLRGRITPQVLQAVEVVAGGTTLFEADEPRP